MLNLLFSYAFYKSTDMDTLLAPLGPYRDKVRVMADSGAFTAWTTGEPVKLTEYAKWLRRWHHQLDYAINLDVVGDAEGTRKNQDRLDKMGLVTMPVFHVREDWSYLEHYASNYDYLLFGGMVDRRYRSVLRPWIEHAMGVVDGRARVHALGTAGPVIEGLGIHSADSSAASQRAFNRYLGPKRSVGTNFGSAWFQDQGHFFGFRQSNTSQFVLYCENVQLITRKLVKTNTSYAFYHVVDFVLAANPRFFEAFVTYMPSYFWGLIDEAR